MLPNIGYKANSTYERDAIFDELEKMGYPVEPQEERSANYDPCLIVVANKKNGATHFLAYDNFESATEYPSPESFLDAAREALKPEAPKILDREYRVTGNGVPAHAFEIGSVVHLIGEIDGSGYFTGQFEGNDCRQLVNMNCVELLPEKPWWTAYKEGDEVWVKGTIGGVELEDCEDGQPLRVDFDDYKLWLTEKAEIKKA